MTFKPTLAINADFSKIQYPVYASPKLDGIRCSIVDGRALSRTLKAIPNRYIFSRLNGAKLNGLDGELIIGSPTATDCYTQSVSGVMKYEGVPVFTYFVFDLHTHSVPFKDRYMRLLNHRQVGSFSSHPYIQLLEQRLVVNEADMLEYEAAKVAEGYEGIILRSPEAPYKYGRSTVKEGYLLRVKRFLDSEAEIIGFEEEMFNGNDADTDELGRTKRSTAAAGLVGKGSLGAFKVRDQVSGVEFSIGTGFTADQRSDAWRTRDRLVGSLVKYKYFPVGVKDKPRHPVFLGYRSKLDV